MSEGQFVLSNLFSQMEGKEFFGSLGVEGHIFLLFITDFNCLDFCYHIRFFIVLFTVNFFYSL